jgi:hypothetical protein
MLERSEIKITLLRSFIARQMDMNDLESEKLNFNNIFDSLSDVQDCCLIHHVSLSLSPIPLLATSYS